MAAGVARVRSAAAVAAMLVACSGPGAAAQASCVGSGDRRVDLATPTFTNPTNITNPLFPVGTTGQTIQLGDEAGEDLRLEITSLPDTKTIRFNNQDLQVRVSSFVAYSGGRIEETALDYFAQDDAGNVWYFGEDVANYEEGVVANHEGTWLAGRDGPPGMIMPAKPVKGDVYRPENIPGFVFEEVTVLRAGKTVDGPLGRVKGAILTRECLMDGSIEEKWFAPGYGEFESHVAADDENVKLALSVPTDAARGAVPGSLNSIAAAAAQIFDKAGDPKELKKLVRIIDRSWDGYERSSTVPPLLRKQMDDATDVLEESAAAGDVAETKQASIDIALAGLDVEMRYRPAPGVDRDRIEVWERQLMLDQANGEPGDVEGDQATIAIIGGRIR